MGVLVGKPTEENKDALSLLALSMYIGEKCVFCKREYKDLDDLKDTIWVGQNQDRRLACLGCWQKFGHNN